MGQWVLISEGPYERLAEAGIEPSVGSVGDSCDNALAETINGLYKAEVIHRRGPGRNFEAVVDLMGKGQLQVKPLITHRFDISAATKAYDVITGKTKEKFLGVLLTYPERKMKEESRVVFPLSSLKPGGSVKLCVRRRCSDPVSSG